MSHSFRQEVLRVLGNILKQTRLEKGLEIADIALHTDLSLDSIKKIEHGNKVAFSKYKSLIAYYNKKNKHQYCWYVIYEKNGNFAVTVFD